MSYAIFRSGGKQFRAEKGTTLRLPTLPGEAGATVEFNDVLLGSDGSNVKVGVPTLKGATRAAQVRRRIDFFTFEPRLTRPDSAKGNAEHVQRARHDLGQSHYCSGTRASGSCALL